MLTGRERTYRKARVQMTEMRTKMTTRFSIIEIFFWMALGDVIGFVSIFLLECGFNNAQIGIIVALACGISVILQPIVASYADMPQSLSLKTIILILTGLQIVISPFLTVLYQKNFWATGILYCILIVGIHTLNPLINALGTECINQGKQLNFGVARGIGSGGYAVLCYILGIVLARTQASIQPLTACLIFIGLAISVMCFPFEKRKETEETTEGKEAGGGGNDRKAHNTPWEFFSRYKKFGVVLIGCVLLYSSHMMVGGFGFQIVVSKGGGSEEAGIVMAIAALAELPVLFVFAYMLKIARCDIWVRISAIAFMVKALLTFWATNMTFYYCVQALQLLGWGLFTVASVYYVNEVIEKRDAIKGQAYMTAAYSLGCIIGAAAGGKLIDAKGVDTMLLWATAASLVGMVILLFAAGSAAKEHGYSV